MTHDPQLDFGEFKSYSSCPCACKYSKRFTLQEAFEERTFPEVLVSANRPYIISAMNELFARNFGYTSSKLLGKALISVSAFSVEGLPSLLNHAAQGQRCCKTFQSKLPTKICGSVMVGENNNLKHMLTCIPVVEVPKGTVRYILVQFYNMPESQPFQGSKTASESCLVTELKTSQTAAAGPSNSTNRIPGSDDPGKFRSSTVTSLGENREKDTSPGVDFMSPHGLDQDFADALADSCGFSPPIPDSTCQDYEESDAPAKITLSLDVTPSSAKSDEDQDAPASPLTPQSPQKRLTILPRRKAFAYPSHEQESPARGVTLTPELVTSLRGMPLAQAAQAVGLSATAFKRACRRLGVRRWEYTRGPAKWRSGYSELQVGHPSPFPPGATGELGMHLSAALQGSALRRSSVPALPTSLLL